MSLAQSFSSRWVMAMWYYYALVTVCMRAAVLVHGQNSNHRLTKAAPLLSVTVPHAYLTYHVPGLVPPLSNTTVSLLHYQTATFYNKLLAATYVNVSFAGLVLMVNNVTYSTGLYKLNMDFKAVLEFTNTTNAKLPAPQQVLTSMAATTKDYVSYITGFVRKIPGLQTTDAVDFATGTATRNLRQKKK